MFGEGSSISLTGAAIGGSGSGYNYAWTGPDSYTSSTQSPTISSSATAVMSGSYNLVVTDGNSCSSSTSSSSITVDVTPSFANFQFASATTICEGATISTFGQVYKSGETDNSDSQAIDAAYLGYSQTNNNVDGIGWTWSAASYNSSSGDANNDELTFDIALPSNGTYFLQI